MADGIALSFFVSSLLILGAKDIYAQQNQADKIFLGGNIITVDDNNPEAQAIAVHDGKIQAIGGETEVSKFRGSKTEVIDLDRKSVV